MKRRFVSCCLLLAMVVSMLSTGVSAEGNNNQIIHFDDGSYMIIFVEDISPRAVNTRVANKYYTYYDGSDNVEWEAKLNASFTYDGTSATCTSANCTVTIYESRWYEISNTTTRSGNTATTQLTMGEKFLGITISKPQYTITLTCDKDGNLS